MPLIYTIPRAGAKEVDDQDDMFILVAPQNAVGNCIIDVSRLTMKRSPIMLKRSEFLNIVTTIHFQEPYYLKASLNIQDLRAMTDAAGERPVILINPRLKVKSLLTVIHLYIT